MVTVTTTCLSPAELILQSSNTFCGKASDWDLHLGISGEMNFAKVTLTITQSVRKFNCSHLGADSTGNSESQSVWCD